MLDSVYHITKNYLNHFFDVKSLRFCHLLRSVIMTSLRNVTKFVNH